VQKDRYKEYLYDANQDPYIELILGVKHKGSVLDLGSGSGRDSLFLARNGFDVTAVDNDGIHLENLTKKADDRKTKINIIKSDLESYRTDTIFDVVISDMVLHFFDSDKISTLINNMQILTKPKGLNIVIAYSDKNPFGKRPYLFKKNELISYYKNWTIIKYEEKPTEWFKLPGEISLRQNHAVYLLAQKS